jgi:hypothetical protein
MPVISASPNPGHESLSTQLETLIIAPLKASGISTIIVIDALDECKDEQSTSAILSVLGRHIDDLSSVKFFITGRPESRIHSGFNLPLLRPQTDVFLLHGVERTFVDHDIRLYLRAQFRELVEGMEEIKFPDPWPSDASVESLVQRAGGLFIFASTTCKFISLRPGNPQKLLQRILDMESRSDFEGKLTLDSLYRQILIENNQTSDLLTDATEQINAILGTTVLVLDSVSLTTLALLLELDTDDILSLLRLLHSVLRVPPSPTAPIAVHHKSFPDFLLDMNRCKDLRFHLDAPKHHARLAIRCLQLMKLKLKRNICDLPCYATNAEVEDLCKRRSERIGESLEYACSSWAQHLSQASRSTEALATVVELMNDFMCYHFMSWLEVLSIAGMLRTAVYSLRDAKAWLDQVRPLFSPMTFTHLNTAQYPQQSATGIH